MRTFGGVVLDHAGTKGNQTTQVIGVAETAAGARSGGSDTSFYFMKFGGQWLTGLQKESPKRLFDAVTDDGVTHRVVFEWPVGLMSFNTRAIGRVRGIKPF